MQEGIEVCVTICQCVVLVIKSRVMGSNPIGSTFKMSLGNPLIKMTLIDATVYPSVMGSYERLSGLMINLYVVAG